MYKGFGNRQQYLMWCEKEWYKHHPSPHDKGSMSINDWAHEFSSAGAHGTFDVFSQGVGDPRPTHLIVFGYLLPASASDIALAFADGLAVAVADGYVTCDDNPFADTLEKEAPSSNTGLSSPPSAN